MKDLDRFIVQKDMTDYEKYLKAQNERKKWQRDMMNQELEQSINLKKAIADREMQIEKIQDNYKSLGRVGEYYIEQKQRQQTIEANQKKRQDEFSEKVSSPHRLKLTQRMQKEINDYQEVRNRYDKEKEFIERQKQ